ncbi:flagellar brake domain-containing protein [Lysinibacillus louembei]|uniref:Flagellar brake domain-containing protein n=1 Tax=Lysinibacillus louembei TaxID=1470088 RepID=A0ABZ0RXR9_9BACI|nr:flagellar brake domain-containing protein [Lysinibacillus louembei]WPK11738.1 flagellar brake domain-containing protein [Lysinibacillus louembei]
MELKIGTMLMLEPEGTDGMEKFRCKVVEKEDGVIYVDYPINDFTKKTAFLLDGTELHAVFYTDGNSYSFTTQVLGRKNDRIPMVVLSCPPEDQFIKIQRREFVRVETPIDVAIEFNGSIYQFIAQDISAGGLSVRLIGAVNFKEGDTVQLTIVLPFVNNEIKYVQTDARIVRIFDENERTIASMQLTDTDDVDKQHIVRLCFERQLLQRKKELNEL